MVKLSSKSIYLEEERGPRSEPCGAGRNPVDPDSIISSISFLSST